MASSNKEGLNFLNYYLKMDEKQTFHHYKDLFKDMGLKFDSNIASELIKNKILKEINKR